MREKIEKLLKSSLHEDILVAINLAYTLPLEEFHSIFKHCNIEASAAYEFYKFQREGRYYAMAMGFITYLNYDLDFEDITPKRYER